MPKESPVAKLFSDDKTQYRVPVYQRRYVWDETNWKELWTDITKLLDTGNKHFTGDVVMRPDEVDSELTKYEIIDGQQRLTTFLVIFCVIRDISASRKYAYTNLKNKMKGFIELDPYDTGREESRIERIEDDDAKCKAKKEFSPYKLVLKGHDRKALQSILKGEKREALQSLFEDGGSTVLQSSDKEKQKIKLQSLILEEHETSENVNRITDAYVHFGVEITSFLNEGSSLEDLVNALTDRFHVVEIELEKDDEPQQIFGSINGTGRALDEFDLLRNDLFLRVGNRRDQEDLYKYWHGFDEDKDVKGFWETPGRTDEFLKYFLTAKLGPMDFSQKRLFHDIYKGQYHKKLRDNLDYDENQLDLVKKEFQELAKYAAAYQEMERNPFTEIGRRRLFYKDLNFIFEDLNLTSLPPFLLHVENELALNKDERKQIYKILESYVLRCQLRYGVSEDKTTTDRINGLFIEVIAGNIEKSGKAFAEYLSAERKRGRRWLGNQGVKDGLRKVGEQMDKLPSSLRRPIWNMLGYILYQIECLKQKKMPTSFKEFSSRFQCTPIVLPSKSKHAFLFSYKYNIGNLTFCKEYPRSFWFSDRQKVLLQEPNTSLILNEGIDKHSMWNVQEIKNRSADLLGCFDKIWPPAESFISRPKSQGAKPKADTQWISMIGSDDFQPTRFVTYTESVELSSIRTHNSKVLGVDFNNKQRTLEKASILLVCSATAWTELHPTIEILDEVERTRLKQPRNFKERLSIVDDILVSAQNDQVPVSLVTRCGHLLKGTIEDFDKEAIYMQIMEHPMIVFRNCLLEFTTDELYEGIVKRWGLEDLYGYIESGTNYPRLTQEIEVKSESLDRNIRPGKLLPNLKVNFNLNIVQKNGRSHFQAHNVELVTTGELHRGKVKGFRKNTGSGFLISSSYPEDIYFRKSHVLSEDINLLQEDQPVEFNIAETVDGQSSVAININLIKD